MTCNKCGHDNAADDRFCAACGAPLMGGTSAAPKEAHRSADITEQSAQPARPVTGNAAEDTSAAPSGGIAAADDTAPPESEPQPADSPEASAQSDSLAEVPGAVSAPGRTAADVVFPEPAACPDDTQVLSGTKPKKKRGRAVKWVAAIAVVILAAAAVLGYIFYPQIALRVMGPTRYYFAAEKKAMASLGDAAEEVSPRDIAVTGKMNASVSGNALTLPDELTQLLQKLSVTIDVQSSSAREKGFAKFALDYQGSELGAVLVSQLKDKTGISFPGLSDAQMAKTTLNAFSSDKDARIREIYGVSEDELTKLCADFLEHGLISAIPSKNTTIGSGIFEGLSCTKITFTIDEALLRSVCLSMADYLEKDSRVAKAAYCYLDYLGTLQGTDLTGMTEQEFLKSFCETLRDAADSAQDAETAYYNVFLAGRGKIVGRELLFPEGNASVVLGTYEKDGMDITDLSVQAGASSSLSSGSSSSLHLHHERDEKGIVKGTLELPLMSGGAFGSGMNIAGEYQFQPEVIGGVKVMTGSAAIHYSVSNYLSSTMNGTSVDFELTLGRQGENGLKTDLSVTVEQMSADEEGISATVSLGGDFTCSDKAEVDHVSVPSADKDSLTDAETEEILSALMRNMEEKIPELENLEKVLQTMILGAYTPDDSEYYDDWDDGDYDFDSDSGDYGDFFDPDIYGDYPASSILGNVLSPSLLR